jgi:hypothetical protein
MCAVRKKSTAHTTIETTVPTSNPKPMSDTVFVLLESAEIRNTTGRSTTDRESRFLGRAIRPSLIIEIIYTTAVSNTPIESRRLFDIGIGIAADGMTKNGNKKITTPRSPYANFSIPFFGAVTSVGVFSYI